MRCQHPYACPLYGYIGICLRCFNGMSLSLRACFRVRCPHACTCHVLYMGIYVHVYTHCKYMSSNVYVLTHTHTNTCTCTYRFKVSPRQEKRLRFCPTSAYLPSLPAGIYTYIYILYMYLVCVCVCVCAHINTHTHKYIYYTSMHIYIYTCIGCVCMCKVSVVNRVYL